ncbi:MAG: NAD(P)-dependent alcohol dehydrogenase [Ilumatobacteraceae bacterium]|nr:NAD(P)-dependent alcohol dehydrogenase [Ilumatobacteraceae bacterium]
MAEPTTYEIVLRGRPSRRLLRPLLDDFTIDAPSDTADDGVTRLVGDVGDPAHLHGIVAHLTSVNIDIISIAPPPVPAIDTSTDRNNMTIQEQPNHEQTDADRLSATQMHAITQDRYGSADVLSFDVVARPEPKPDEVLIEVVAAGVDRGTCHLMSGTPYLIRFIGFGLTRPKQTIPGLDVAGRVVAVGSKVTRFVPGDEVFGLADGSLAEYTTAHQDKLTVKPANVSFEQAAAVPVSGVTALQAVSDIGDAQAGQHVLIVGASGGVGSFAVQIAKAVGAEVTAVASTRNLDFMRSLGADHVVDYTAEDFTATDQRYDLIIDIGGRNSVRRLRSVLTTTGTLVIVGGEGGNRFTGGIGRQLRAVMLSPFVEQRLTMFVSTTNPSRMERLAEHLATGAVVPAVQASHPLADAAAGIAQLDSGKATGKTVVVVRDDGADHVE